MLIKIVKSQHGFGFFGMMVLVIVLAVMGSLVMVTIDTTTSNQAMQETVAKMERISVAIARYKADHATGRHPDTLAYLISNVGAVACTSVTGSSKMQGWCGPYLEVRVANDPTDYATDGWNTAFEYSYNGATFIGTLYSWGPNKTDNNGASDDITRTFP